MKKIISAGSKDKLRTGRVYPRDLMAIKDQFNVGLTTISELLRSDASMIQYSSPFLTAACAEEVIHWNIEEGYYQPFRIEKSSIAMVDAESKTVVVGSVDGTIRVWNTETNQSTQIYEAPEGALHISSAITQIKKAGNYIIAGFLNGDLRVWNKNSFNKWELDSSIISIHDTASPLTHVSSGISSIDMRDNRLLIGSKDGSVKIFDIKVGEVVYRFDVPQDWHKDSRCLPNPWKKEAPYCPLLGNKDVIVRWIDDSSFLTASYNGSLIVWDVINNKYNVLIFDKELQISQVDFSKKQIAIGCTNGDVFVFDKTGFDKSCYKPAVKLARHTELITGIYTNGNYIITTSLDGKLIVWDRSENGEWQCRREIIAPSDKMESREKAASADSRWDSDEHEAKWTNPITCLDVSKSFVTFGTESGEICVINRSFL